MAIHANSRWNICFRSFLLSLCLKLMQCLQYMRQSMSRFSLMSSAFGIFAFLPILLLKPLQFSPIIQNIPCCYMLGVIPCTCNSPSSTALSTLLCLSMDAVAALPFSFPSLNQLSAFISLMISCRSLSCNLPCFLNWSALILNCLIIVVCFCCLKLSTLT